MLEKQLYLKVHEAFINERYDKWPSEHIKHASYDCSLRVRNHKWRFISEDLVADHLRELSNSLNMWGARIIDLQSWSKVLPHYDEDTQWAIRSAMVEIVSAFCLQQPYSLRERFVCSVTQILHQSNLNVYPFYMDELPHDRKDKYLSTKEKMEALEKVGEGWSAYPPFKEALLYLNDGDFKVAVRNYRNLANHAIAPHLEWGHGISVNRRLEYVDDLIELEDGTLDIKTDSSRKRVVYGFGGSPPLTLEQVISAVVKQYGIAHKTLEKLNELIQEICSHLPGNSEIKQND
jgi:hypothetical protein